MTVVCAVDTTLKLSSRLPSAFKSLRPKELRYVTHLLFVSIVVFSSSTPIQNTSDIHRNLSHSPLHLSRNYQVQLVLVGRKGEQWFIRRPTPVAATFLLGNVPQPSVGSDLANLLVGQFLSGDVDAAEIIFTRFNNLISYDPTIRTLLPLSLSGIESEDDEVFKVTSKDGKMVMAKLADKQAEAPQGDYIFEDEPVGILETMLTLYFSATIMRCMQESVASELASRMTAMQSASNNAKKITERLSQVYNRARQSTVTAEILEISAGAAALADA